MKITNGLIGLVVNSLLSIILAYGAIKSFKFSDFVERIPSILVKNGKIMEKNPNNGLFISVRYSGFSSPLAESFHTQNLPFVHLKNHLPASPSLLLE